MRRTLLNRGTVPRWNGANVTTERPTVAAMLATGILLVAACSDDGGNTTDNPSPVSATTVAPDTTTPATETTQATETAAARSTTAATEPDHTTRTTPADDTAPATTPVVDGPCMDPSSPVATAALASLGATAPGGDDWVAGAAYDGLAPCPQLVWLMAETPGGTASSPSQVLFFHDGAYLGTATSDAYAYTTVVGTNGNTVSVQYRWLEDDDANCCPSGGPTVIDYVWDSRVVMTEPLPQEMLDSYAG